MAKRRSRGEGTIYFSSRLNIWIAKIWLPTGERKTKSAKTQKEVRNWLLKQRKTIKDGLLVEDESITLQDFLTRFMNDVVKHTLRPKTISSYAYLIDNHILPELGNMRLAKIRPDHLQNLYSKKIEAGLSTRTVQYIHAVLRRALNQAVKWGLLNRNPANLVDAPRPKKKAPETLSIEQVKQFLNSVKEHRWYSIYVLAISTGMREGELLGLHWEDVDIKHGQLYVQHQVQFIPGQGLVISEPKTDKSRRTITLTPIAMQALEALGKTTGLVFKTSNDTPISPRNLQRHFHQVLEQAGLPKMRFHNLRHTAASLLLTQNVHPKIVQEMLGHSSIALTLLSNHFKVVPFSAGSPDLARAILYNFVLFSQLDTYSHIIPSLQKEAAEKMEKILNA